MDESSLSWGLLLATKDRIDRYKTTILSMLNQAVLLSRHAKDKSKARRRYFVLMGRRVIAEFLKDGPSRRFSFPQLRGILMALNSAPKIFKMTPKDLEAWYLEKQDRIIKR